MAHRPAPPGANALFWLGVVLPLVTGPRLARAAPAEPMEETEQPEAPADAEPADEDDPQLQRAMDAYKRGTKNFNEGKYEEALADYTEAASLYASPDFQYNIARCYEELEKFEEAIRAFSAYLRAKPEAADRATVEQRIKLLEKLNEERKAAAAAAAAKKDEPKDEPPPTGDAKADQRRKLARPLILSGAVIGSVGAAVAIGGGVALGVLAGKKSDELDEIQTGGNPTNASFGEAQDIESSGQRFETLQIALAAGGAGVAVIGGVLLGVGFSFKKGPSNAALVPSLGRGHAGLSLSGRF